MKVVRGIFVAGYTTVIVLFVCCGVALIYFAALELWHGINPNETLQLRERFNSVLESIGLLTIAVVAFELGQTILEEEVQREVKVSAPTRVRRFLSRFMVVVVVALSIETLVAVFNFVHEDTSRLLHAASVGVAAAALMAAWGLFVKFNKSAEELEPEAMEETKNEDSRVD